MNVIFALFIGIDIKLKVVYSTVKWYKKFQFLLNFTNSFAVRNFEFLQKDREISMIVSK